MNNKQINVLVVDNNPVIVKALSSFLLKKDCIVQTADNGLKALEIIRSNNSIDIVFTDLLMPLVEGDVLCKIIKSQPEFEHIFVVILSAMPSDARTEALKEIPYDLCYPKGHILELGKQVQEALASYEAKKLGINETQQHIPVEGDVEPSEYKAITSELVSKTNYLNSILSGLTEGVVELDSFGVVIGVNESAMKILGISQVDLIGQDFSSLMDWGKHRKTIRSWVGGQLIMQGGESLFLNETNPLSFNDKIVTCNLSVMNEGDYTFGIVILHDISRQHRAEKNKKQIDSAMALMRKMDAMRGMAGGFAHDFNNLLAAICGNLDMFLMTQNSKDDDADSNNDLIINSKHAAEVAVDLTRRISSFSNFGIVRRIKFEMSSLIQECADKYFSELDANLKLNLETANIPVMVDDEEVYTVLSNIFENSIEAKTDEKLEISITTQAVDFELPQLQHGQYIPAGKYGQIIITDNGKGVALANIIKVFDPYFSTKERGSNKGMGLGLAMVYSLMRSHGGYVVFSSELGVGTTISLFFPVEEIEEAVEPEEEIIKPLAIITNADKQLVNLNQVMLIYLGYEVLIFDTIEDITHTLKTDNLTELAWDTSKPVVVLCGVNNCQIASIETLQKDLLIYVPEFRIIAMCENDSIKEISGESALPTIKIPFTMDQLQHTLETAGVEVNPLC